MVNVDRPRYDSLCDPGACQHDAPFVQDLHNVTIGDAPRLCIEWVHPEGLIVVAVRAFDLAGVDLPQPLHVVMLGMDAPARVVGDDE